MSDVTQKAVNPGDIKFQITATFTLDQWRKIAKTLCTDGEFYLPANELVNSIRDCIFQAETVYLPRDRGSDDE
ncbi:MAG: hypothetical protein JAY60_19585 [Candidatus Thiodiazotropha weberae]|nr:hypothetical protein [Candidatus Thiodiazotropha weberae]